MDTLPSPRPKGVDPAEPVWGLNTYFVSDLELWLWCLSVHRRSSVVGPPRT